jgi:hypothetical protein
MVVGRLGDELGVEVEVVLSAPVVGVIDPVAVLELMLVLVLLKRGRQS